ncbi:MAG: hypothetical protein ACR2F9_02440 [Longimicrobiaceae bacterium]
MATPRTHRKASIAYSVGALDDVFGAGYLHGSRGELLERMNVFGDTSRTFLHDDQGQLTRWQEYANTKLPGEEDQASSSRVRRRGDPSPPVTGSPSQPTRLRTTPSARWAETP